MTDVINSDAGTQDLSTGDAEAAQEKMLPQSKVNDLLHKRTSEVATKHEKIGYQRALDEMKSQQSAQAPQGQIPNQQQQADPEMVRRIIAEEQAKGMHMQMANQFLAKLDTPSENEPEDHKDIIEAMKSSLPNMPEIVHLANTTDNVRDVMVDLRKNPSKLAQLRVLAYTDPSLAREEMQKLSNSIKANRAAANAPKAPDPLSQIKTSSLSMDNGERNSSDYRMKYRGSR